MYTESAQELRRRYYALSFNGSPATRRFLALIRCMQECGERIDVLDLGAIPSILLASLLYCLGIKGVSRIIEELLLAPQDEEMLLAVASISKFRHQLLYRGPNK